MRTGPWFSEISWELPQPVFQAIQRALEAFGKDLATMKPEESLGF